MALHRNAVAVIAGLLASAMLKASAPTTYFPPSAILDGAPADAWQDIPTDNLLLMEFADGRRVVIELATDFAPVHAANIRALVRGRWYEGGRITRVEDNRLAIWVGAHSDQRELTIVVPGLIQPPAGEHPAGVLETVPAERERAVAGADIHFTDWKDGYATKVGYANGWPVGSDGSVYWLAHCYGTVSVPLLGHGDYGSGVEMFSMIGQAAREFDDNYPVVGRIVDGADTIATLPRGSGDRGFYQRKDPTVLIRRLVLVSDLPLREQPHFQTMRTSSQSFYAYLRAWESAPFGPAGHRAEGADVCNAAVPVRQRPTG